MDLLSNLWPTVLSMPMADATQMIAVDLSVPWQISIVVDTCHILWSVSYLIESKKAACILVSASKDRPLGKILLCHGVMLRIEFSYIKVEYKHVRRFMKGRVTGHIWALGLWGSSVYRNLG